MAQGQSISARKAAQVVLDQFGRSADDVAPMLHEWIGRTEEKGRAMDLVYGVIRNRGLLDRVIAEVSGVAIGRINRRLVNVLRIGAYEMVYLPGAAEHAVVNEAVNLVRGRSGEKQAGFVNAVLRNLQRAIVSREAGLSRAVATRTVPRTQETGCEFDRDLLADPGVSAGGYLSQAFSLPRWLVDSWIEAYGEPRARDICFASNRRPGVYVQPNELRTTAEGLAEEFARNGVEFEAVGGMLQLRGHGPVDAMPGYVEGLFYVQDPMAAAAVDEAGAGPGETVIDLCAAPGTKTVRLAGRMRNEGVLLATDIQAKRRARIEENVARLGASMVRVVDWPQIGEAAAELVRIDAIVLDVPCSNTGVLARRPEVRHRITPRAVEAITGTQLSLLEQAAGMARTETRIVYSTCSIQPEENEEMVAGFVRRAPQWRVEKERLMLPGIGGAGEFDHDGGFVAILRRQ